MNGGKPWDFYPITLTVKFFHEKSVLKKCKKKKTKTVKLLIVKLDHLIK